MSAAGFTPIQLYRTTTASAVPSAGNLAAGELAINLTDEALYFKNAAGVVTLLADSSGALGSVTSVNASGGTTGLTFSGGPITSSGTLTLGGTLAVANGGTGVTTSTGTGSVVLSNSPTLVTPTLGAASATSIANGLGAVGTPSYTFTGDTNTGMWSPSSDAIAFSTAGSERVRVDSSGNVGVGINSPQTALEVYRGAGTAAYLSLIGNNGVASQLYVGQDAAGLSRIFQNGANPITVWTNGTERMRITAAGDVLVGTTANPQNSKLMVGGTVQVKPATNNSLEILGPNTGTGIRLFARNDAGTPNRLELQGGQVIFPLTTGADGLYFDATSGNVGIGTSSPDTKLHTVGGNVWSSNFFEVGRFQRASGTGVSLGYDNSAYVATIGAYSHDGTASNLSFWTYPGSGSALERMRITAAGDVGIGTTSYVGKLSVSLGNATGFGAPPVWDNTYAIFGGTTANAAAVGIGFNSGIGGSITALSPGVAWHPMSYLASDHRFILAGSEAMRLNSAGNLGLGVTPSAWWASTRAFDLGANASLFSFASGANVQTGITNNAFINSSVQYVYKTSAAASNYLQNSGEHIWFNAPSGTAGNAVTFTQAMTLNASGNLGIGTASPGFRLTAVGASTAGSVTALAIENPSTNAASEVRQEWRAGGSSWGYITTSYNSNAPFMAFGVSAASASPTERMRIDSSGNVGIGVTNPNARLSVSRGSAGVIANITDGVAQSLQVSSGSGYIGFLNPNFGAITFRNGSDNAEFMRIDSSGNVGIGTSSPAGRFAVNAGGTGSAQIVVDQSSDNPYITINRFTGAVNSFYGIRFTNSVGDLAISTAPGGAQDGGQTFTERMRITSAGNVGIGTSSFTDRLAVNGSVAVLAGSELKLLNSANSGFGSIVSAGGGSLSLRSYGNEMIQLNEDANILFKTSGGSERMRIDSAGNLGIGTSSPGQRLTVVSSSTSLAQFTGPQYAQVRHSDGTRTMFTQVFDNEARLFSETSTPLVLGTNNTERMRIDSSGNLLVGTTTQLASTRQTVVSGSNGVAVQVANGAVGSYMTNTSGTGDWQPFSFNVNGTSFTQVGSITITGGTTTNYNTSSDYRLKEIDGPIQNSGAYIDALKPVQGSWKADGSRFIGLLAHEVQEVSETQIATGEKDGEQMQAMDYSAPEIIANLIAEIQSLRARVAQLEGN